MNYLLANYYINNKDEFYGEDGHTKLLVGIKLYMTNFKERETIQVVGIDVGSCIGNYIFNIKDICYEDNAQILCIEPNPVNLIKLEKIIENDNSIKLFKCCISDISGIESLYNWKDSSENNEGNEIAGLRSGGKKICDIEVRRLDDILDSLYKDKEILIKFIKIDTEGNDTNVIKSLGRYIKKVKCIIFECSDCLDDIRGPGIENPMRDIVKYLSDNGFDTFKIGTNKLIKINDECWNDIYEDIKFHSNCFALQKEDPLLFDLIENDFSYKF